MNTCTKPHLQVLLSAYELGILPEREKGELEEHLLECDRCCEDLYATSPVVGMRSTPTGKTASRTRMWFRPVAAAALILALAGTFSFFEQFSDVRRNYPAPGTSITLLGPQGTVEGDQVTFSWTSESTLSAYGLTIFDERGDSIGALRTTRTDTSITVKETAVLVPGNTYYWRIVGELDGRVVSVTPISMFRIAAE